MARNFHAFLKLNIMPDNPNKKGQDRKFESKQKHEQAYQKSKALKGKSNSNNGGKPSRKTKSE